MQFPELANILEEIHVGFLSSVETLSVLCGAFERLRRFPLADDALLPLDVSDETRNLEV